MLVIRLSRTGRKKVPTYRILVAEKSAAVKGKFHEIVGNYSPALATPELKYNKERILHWVSQGAQPSETLARILTKDGFEEMSKFFDAKKKYHKKKKGKKEEKKEGTEGAPAEEAKPVEDKPADDSASSSPSGEAPVEEKKEEVPAEETKSEEAPTEDAKQEEAPTENK